MTRKFKSCFIMSQRQFALILCICTNFTVILCASSSFSESNENISHILPAYAVAERAYLLNSTTCGRELQDFRNAVDQRILWSLKILDSSGKPTSGFLYGNNFWLGVRSQCFDAMNKDPLQISEKALLNNTLYRDPEKEFPPFQVNYFVAYFRHNSTLQYHIQIPNEDLITLGLCLPTSCTVNDITFVLERIFRDRVLQIGDLYSMDFKLIEVKDLKDDHQWLSTGAIPFICVALMLTFSIMIIGTMYDIFVHQKYFTGKNKTIVNTQHVEEEMATLSLHRESRIGQILRCFSVYTNTKIIFNTKLEADAIPIIHGLRFLTMSWVIMVHSMLYSVDYIDNKPMVMRISDGFFVQVLSNASISVDTFFFLSGFLLAYLYLRNHADEERKKLINYRAKLNEFFVFIIRRFIRLTPAYMMTIGIIQLDLFWYDKTSIFYTYERPHETCAKYWWTNILYMSNFYDRNIMCMSWSWYLANDMQFYIIGVALLILSTAYLYWTIVTLCALLIGSIVLSGYISYVYEYVPTLDELFRLSNIIYFPPWVRIGPYIIGMLTGFFIIRLNKTLVLKKRTIILCWCFGSICNILVLFSLYKRHISVLSTATYVALSRTIWAIGLAWILIACLTKNGGIVDKLLSFRGWIPFSRLTYCAYLLNPFIIQAVRLNSETSMHIDFAPISIVYLGYFATSYLCAYALSLMTETPYVLLTRIYIESWRRREYKSREIVISRTKV